MTQEQFISAIKIGVSQTSVSSVIANLENPPGRQPDASLVELSDWYKKLDDVQKEMIKRIIEMAVNHSVFGFLSVIDGVSSVSAEANEDASFKLSYMDNGIEYMLNDPDDDYLHDIYNSE